MTYLIGIIGLGTIAKRYLKGLVECDSFVLKAVCDNNPNKAASLKHYSSYPLYENYEEMLDMQELDVVIISTPPNTHYEIAKYVLSQNIGVLLEKPGVLNIENLYDLINIAQNNKLIFDVIFHWQHSNEVIFLNQNLNMIENVKSVQTVIKDPYTNPDNKTILSDKITMGGTWFDSGVNVLSMIHLLFNLENFMTKESKFQVDPKSGFDYYSYHTFTKNDYIETSIEIDWRENISFKQTQLIFDNDIIDVLHHEETIYKNDKLIFKGQIDHRLDSHYANYFKAFDASEINHRSISIVHEYLLNKEARHD